VAEVVKLAATMQQENAKEKQRLEAEKKLFRVSAALYRVVVAALIHQQKTFKKAVADQN